MNAFIVGISTFILIVLGTLVFFLSRCKRCPSDKVLVIYGKTGGNRSSRCVHGGVSFVWPLIQDFKWLDLTPISIDTTVQEALSKESFKVEAEATFTVGISTEKGVMETAAERLLGLNLKAVNKLAFEIVMGELRKTIATLKLQKLKPTQKSFLIKFQMGLYPV